MSRTDSFPFPFTFGRALEMVKAENKDVAHLLLVGLNYLNFTYFPGYIESDMVLNGQTGMFLKYFMGISLPPKIRATWNF